MVMLVHAPFLLLFLLSCIAFSFNPSTSPVMGVLGLMFPVFLGIHLLFTAFWLYRGKKFGLLSMLALLFAWPHYSSGIQFGNSQETEADFKVMTYNLRMWYPHNQESRPQMKEDVNAILDNHQPDILLVQEHKINGEYAELDFPYRSMHPMYRMQNNGIGVYSKYEILNSGFFTYSESRNGYTGFVWADIKIKNKTLRLISVHLVNTALIPESYQTLGGSGPELTQEQIEAESADIYNRLAAAYQVRAVQADELSSFVADSPYPVLLCGDLNDTHTSYVYDRITERLDDAFSQKGKGFGDTFNRMNAIPLRIDYILHSPELECASFEVINVPYSDHKPVTASFTLPSSQGS